MEYYIPIEKELTSLDDITTILKNKRFPRPRWLINSDIEDNIWYVSQVGVDIDFFKQNTTHCNKINFKRKISPIDNLTDKGFGELLTDLKNTILYLDLTGKVSRPLRAANVLRTACHLMVHANELRLISNKPLISKLEQIKINDVKDYLECFAISESLLTEAINHVVKENPINTSYIDFELLKNKLNIKTTRTLYTLKDKIKKYIKQKSNTFGNIDITYEYKSTAHSASECENANIEAKEFKYYLYPSEKIISNTISHLNALYQAKQAQKHAFNIDVYNIFHNGESIFEFINSSNKTNLIPSSIYLHLVSSAFKFVHNYGSAIHDYFNNLCINESRLIKESGYLKSTLIARLTSDRFSNQIFDVTPIPKELIPLNLIGISKYRNTETGVSARRHMYLAKAIELYTASMYILIASFTGARVTSIITAKRNCFQQSPIDDLFDIKIRIPKSSKIPDLIDTFRPIPERIFDFGLEFTALADDIETRRNVSCDESNLFLFSKSLISKFLFSFRPVESNFYQGHLSDDTINFLLVQFSDYIESPLINGKRWYPATHQFRKFLAVLYFNMSNNQGLEELSWMLGHSGLEQTFHYAELDPDSDWEAEAEHTIAQIASSSRQIHADEQVTAIVNKARSYSQVNIVIEQMVTSLIKHHKNKTGQAVRFVTLEDKNIFFYFEKVVRNND